MCYCTDCGHWAPCDNPNCPNDLCPGCTEAREDNEPTVCDWCIKEIGGDPIRLTIGTFCSARCVDDCVGAANANTALPLVEEIG